MISTRDKHLIIDFVDKHGADAKDKFKIYAELYKMIEDKPFDFSNTSILGSLVVNEPNRIGSVIYEPNDLDLLGKFYKYRDEEISSAREKYELSCIPDFSKMSISQGIKIFESKTVEFEEMIEFCKAECCQLYTGEFWFNGSMFSFDYKKVFVSYSKRQISNKDGYNFKTLKELIDYVDSWWH